MQLAQPFAVQFLTIRGGRPSLLFFISFFVFLAGEIGISAVSEYGRMGAVSEVTHPSIDILRCVWVSMVR